MKQCPSLSHGILLVLCLVIQGIHGKTGGGTFPSPFQRFNAFDKYMIGTPCMFVEYFDAHAKLVYILSPTINIGITPDEVVPSPSPTSSPEPTAFEIVTSPPISGENLCRTTDSGVFGDIDGEPLVVSFNYAVELAEGTSESEFTSLLLPDLEVAMNNAILPTLFPECSNTTTTQRRVSSKQRELIGTIAGVSTRPFDSISNDIECTGSNCHGLLGVLTIFISPTQRRRRFLQEEPHTTVVRNTLKDSMDAGAFNDIAESIISVTWMDDGLEETPVEEPPPSTDDDTSTNRSSGNNQVVGWTTAVGAAALLVVVVAAITRRRRRNNNYDDQSAIEGNSTINSAI